ncbi:cation channel sperm-associated auxiliary subunit epsilon isoform X2 [Notamacropus eugenii]
MFCTSQGIHSIKPKIKNKPPNAEERHLFVDRSTDCFLWYFLASHVKGKPYQNIQVWVYDPENASPAELAGRASNPSVTSKSLSMQFLSMGQEPYFLSTVSHDVYHSHITNEEGIWESQIPLIKTNLFMVIKGNSVALQDCFISDYIFLFSHISLTFSQSSEYVKMTAAQENTILFDWPPCFPSTIATVSHWETLFTKDAFNTSHKIRIPPNILTDEERQNILQVCIIEEGIVVLIAGSIYLRTENDFIKLDEEYGIPPNVTGIKTRTYCWPEYTPKDGEELSQIVVWTKEEVLLGYSNQEFLLLVTLEELLEIINMRNVILELFCIHFVTYTSDPTGVALLLTYERSSSLNMLFLVFYDEDTLEWHLQDFIFIFPQGKKLTALFMYSALPNFVIWDDEQVYYSYQNFSYNGYLETSTGSHNLAALTNSTIHQVFMDYYGNGVIKMYNNKMLYFKIEITRVTQLHQWAKKSDNTLLLINPTGELFLANIKHGKAEFSEYPLMLELYSSTYEEHTSCPYMLFESSMILRNIYLDKRKQLTFWVQVIYRENNGVYPIVEIYGPNILKEKRYGDYEIASGICTKNMTVTFYQDIDYEGIENYYNIQDENMGHVMIQLRPSHFSKTCLLSNKAIHVFVGCFAERHLKVRGYSNTECHYTNNSYVIEKKYLSGNQPKDMYVNYSVSQYGCPLKVPMTEKFQPVLLLYDAGKLVEEVEANFVLWEIFGRNDFGYELSMSEAGCVNEAQSWQSMISKNKDLPIEEVWGPHNYRHCFSFSIGKPGDLLKPYEIFNLTNKNKIVWKNHHVGLYVFQAKIIDPNYSFCNLTVTFAVETFGILPETNPLLVLFFMIILLFFVIICLIVSYFRYLKFFRKFLYEPSLESKRKKKQKQ